MAQHTKKESTASKRQTQEIKATSKIKGKSQETITKARKLQNGHVKTLAANTITTSAAIVANKKPGKSNTSSKNKNQKSKKNDELDTLLLWRRPVDVLKYSGLELVALLQSSFSKLLQQQLLLAVLLLCSIVLGIVYCNADEALIVAARQNIWFFIYWIGLGVLSSVGLGTGLHTFLLYLGPHIARVTLSAYECNSLDFPQPPYPDDIVCPEEPYVRRVPDLWSLMAKVRLEAFLWGAGTALGELPPFFMARAARLSGSDPNDDEELAEFEALRKKRNSKDLSLLDRGKLFMERLVERVGFFGILGCASIPNPLFDLAGITCGHFLVPFWTFFGATLIGKAIIKMHIQKIFVIIAFNEALIERAVGLLARLPVVGSKLQEPFMTFLQNQKQRLHRNKSSNKDADSGNLISNIFEIFVIAMVCYFVVSIINSLAQNYHKRITKQRTPKSSSTTVVASTKRSKHKKVA